MVGLLMERFSEKDWHKNLDDFRHCKSRKFWGEWAVIGGIVVEIVAAGWFAKDEWQNTPARMQVNSISATAEFWVGTNWDNPGTRFFDTGFAEAFLSFSEKTNFTMSTNDLVLDMTCDKVKWIPCWNNPTTGENGSKAILYFKLDPLYGEWRSVKALNKPAGELIKDLKFISIVPSFLEGNTVKIYNGKVVLMLNGVSKTFVIPDQKLDLNLTKGELGQTNAAGIPIKLSIDNF